MWFPPPSLGAATSQARTQVNLPSQVLPHLFLELLPGPLSPRICAHHWLAREGVCEEEGRQEPGMSKSPWFPSDVYLSISQTFPLWNNLFGEKGLLSSFYGREVSSDNHFECWSGARVGQEEPLTLECQLPLPSPTLRGSESGVRDGSWEGHQVQEQDVSPLATQPLPFEVRSPFRLGSTHHRPFPRKSGMPLLQPSPPHIHLHCTPPPHTPRPELHVFLCVHTMGKNALSGLPWWRSG